MGKRLYSQKREAFRKLIKQARVDAGLTQIDLAHSLKRHQSYISDYERGNRRLDWVAVDEILAACNCTIDDFARHYKTAVAGIEV